LPEILAVRGRDPRVSGWLEQLGSEQRVTLLQGPRASDPRRFGVPAQVWDWYVEGDPASFGLSLARLERLLLERDPGALLIGDGQGAALVLALACCWPERLAGVIAIDGTLPELPDGALAEAPMAGLPVFLAGGALDSAPQLEARGARVIAVP
jgi:predicted esterase